MKKFFSLLTLSLFLLVLVGCNAQDAIDAVNNVSNAAQKQNVEKIIKKAEVIEPNLLPEEKETKDWAIMIYGSIDIEKNLEKALLQEVADIMKIGNAGNTVHILAQLDFRNAKNIPTKRYYVEKNKLIVRGEMPNQNMGDPNTFADFLRWALKYPANHRMLFVLGHGTGWISVAGPGSIMDEIDRSGIKRVNNATLKYYDGRSFAYDHTSNDSITLNEASQVFSRVLRGKKIDVLAFRSCLMNEIETAYQFSDYCDYMVATQTSQYGVAGGYLTAVLGIDVGFDTYVLKKLQENGGALSPREMAKAMYISLKNTNLKLIKGMKQEGKLEFSANCLDLRALRKVIPVIREFADLGLRGLKKYPEKMIEILNAARYATPKFGGIFEGYYGTKPDDYEYVDLGSLMQSMNYELLTKSKEVGGREKLLYLNMINASAKIRMLLQRACVAKFETGMNMNDNEEGVGVTSIFMFPKDDQMVRIYNKVLKRLYGSLKFNKDTRWNKFLEKYYSANVAFNELYNEENW